MGLDWSIDAVREEERVDGAREGAPRGRKAVLYGIAIDVANALQEGFEARVPSSKMLLRAFRRSLLKLKALAPSSSCKTVLMSSSTIAQGHASSHSRLPCRNRRHHLCIRRPCRGSRSREGSRLEVFEWRFHLQREAHTHAPSSQLDAHTEADGGSLPTSSHEHEHELQPDEHEV